MKSLNKFRITTNGIEFQIEKLFQHRFLFWKWQKYYPLGHYIGGHPACWVPTRYQNLASAEDNLQQIKKQDQTDLRGFQPIDETVNK